MSTSTNQCQTIFDKAVKDLAARFLVCLNAGAHPILSSAEARRMDAREAAINTAYRGVCDGTQDVKGFREVVLTWWSAYRKLLDEAVSRMSGERPTPQQPDSKE